MDTCNTLQTLDTRYIVIIGVMGAVASAIPYGAQLVLQWICIIILRRPTSTSARGRNLLLGATLLMTAFSTVYLACTGAAASMVGFLDSPWQDIGRLWPGVGMNTTVFFNVWIGDAVVFWRAWVLWKHKRKAVYIPGALLLCSAAAALALSLFRIVVTSIGRQVDGPIFIIFLSLALGLSFVTNLATNISIGYYAWLHRKAVRGFLANGSQYARHEKVLILVLESGIAYTFILLLGGTIVCISLSLGNQTHMRWILVNYVVTSLGMGMVSIYPSLLIVAVFLRKSILDSADDTTYTKP